MFQSLRIISSGIPRPSIVSRFSSSLPPVTRSPASNVEESLTVPERDKLYKKLEVELRGCDPAVLNSYTWFAKTAAGHLGIEVGNCYALRKPQHNRFTLLKSVFVHKNHRVQYEIRTYFHFMNFHKLTGSTLDTFLEYIERNLPEGIALKATKVEIQELPEHLSQRPPPVNSINHDKSRDANL